MTKYRLKADIRIEYDGIVVDYHHIYCAYCGKKQSLRISQNSFTLPDDWMFVFDSKEHTARVMCDKCYDKYD